MSARPDPTEFLTPINRLTTEFDQFTNELGGPHFRPAWAGFTVYLGLLENA